ncbi:hypothetical protein, partial [Metabacillus halosaccharovorans]|uniref:hypothetical protein n=1 Tax=Metabacillus halosaccharovorans TaxID=930124 RepID=UPI003736EC62
NPFQKKWDEGLFKYGLLPKFIFIQKRHRLPPFLAVSRVFLIAFFLKRCLFLVIYGYKLLG